MARNEKRLIRMSVFLICAGVFTPALFGQKPNDAICKGKPLPAGMVPTGEMISPAECPVHDPYEKNAWILGKVGEGVVSCTAPDYEHDSAENIRFLACGKQVTSDCSPHLDGTPNGIILRSSKSCSLSFIQDMCDRQPENLEPFTVLLTYTHLEVCGNSPGLNARRLVHLEPGQVSPACGLQGYNSEPFFFGPRQADTYIEGNPTDVYVDRLIIVREFFNPDCIGRNRYGINAIVVKRIVVRRTEKPHIFACADSLDQPRNKFHDDRCGVSNGDNAVLLDFSITT